MLMLLDVWPYLNIAASSHDSVSYSVCHSRILLSNTSPAAADLGNLLSFEVVEVEAVVAHEELRKFRTTRRGKVWHSLLTNQELPRLQVDDVHSERLAPLPGQIRLLVLEEDTEVDQSFEEVDQVFGNLLPILAGDSEAKVAEIVVVKVEHRDTMGLLLEHRRQVAVDQAFEARGSVARLEVRCGRVSHDDSVVSHHDQLRKRVAAPLPQLADLERDVLEREQRVRLVGREKIVRGLADLATLVGDQSVVVVGAHTSLQVDVGSGAEGEQELEVHAVALDLWQHVGAHKWIGLDVVHGVHVPSFLVDVGGRVADPVENVLVEFVWQTGDALDLRRVSWVIESQRKR